MRKNLWAAVLLAPFSLSAVTSTWTATGSSNWNINANPPWDTATFPNMSTDNAVLGDAILADSTVTLGQNIGIGILTINSTSNAYTIAAGNTLTLTGSGSLALELDGPSAGKTIQVHCPITFTSVDGNVFFNSGSGGNAAISGNITLTGNTHFFTVNNGTQAIDLSISGAISGPAGSAVQKSGTGTMEFAGATSNSYAANTVVALGTLLLNKTGGALSIPANCQVFDVLKLGNASNQFAATANVLLLGTGVWDMNNFPATLHQLTFTATTSIINPNTITLNSNGTALFLGVGSTMNVDQLVFSGGGSLTVTGASGSATLTGSNQLNLSGNVTPIIVPSGTNLSITKVIANGGINKQNPGTLILSGANTYAGGTTVTAGVLQGDTTSLQGNITNNASLVFDQSTTGTYSGAISGTGALTKQGSGTVILTGNNFYTGSTSLTAGTLVVNGTLAGGGVMTTSPGTILKGTGTITKNLTIQGTLNAGNSIGTINLVGNQTIATGATLAVELSPTAADLTNITGSLTIQPGATMAIQPDFGTYTRQTYTVVHTTSGITGSFSSITNPMPTLHVSVVQSFLDIMLVLQGFVPFSDLFPSGNAGAVAKCLDSLQNVSCSNLSEVLDILHFIPSTHALENALLQLQPSAFTSLAVATENATLYMRDAIFDRLEQPLHSCLYLNDSVNVWFSAVGGHTLQKNAHRQPGFLANSPGSFLGLDSRFAKRIYFGGGIGYTHTHLHWKQKRGHSNMQTAYGSLYGRFASPRIYFQYALIGGYNFYTTHREIDFADAIDMTAKGFHHGAEGSASVQSGLKYCFSHGWGLLPFIALDYIYVHEDGFKERGARSLNLKVHSKNSDLLVSQAGLDVSRCFLVGERCVTPFAKLSLMRESRFTGSKEKASFQCGCDFTVHGLNPSRTLGALEVGLNALFPNSSLTFSYVGKFSTKYNDQSLDLQYKYQF